MFDELMLRRELETAQQQMADTNFQELRQRGIGAEQLFRCTYPGRARIRVIGNSYLPDNQGSWAYLLGVWWPGSPAWHDNAMLVDLVAFHPARPDRWAQRVGIDTALGADNLWRAMETGEPIIMHSNPVAWLRAGGEGACDLHRASQLHRMQELSSEAA